MTKASTSEEQFPGAQPTGNGAPGHCQWRGCSEAGIHRAPQDQTLTDYYLFCLEHVRLYNAQWNYHEGKGAEDMEVEFRSAATWDRPTWKMGERHSPGRPWHTVHDPFDVYREAAENNERHGGKQNRNSTKASAEETKARRTLGFSEAVSMDDLKTRYKELVKRYHPDANGGSAVAEDRMKTINAAYQILRSALTPASE